MLADGAMGTYIIAKGVPLNHPLPELLLSHPTLIETIHREYAEAGARVLLTHSFSAHKMKLATWGLEGQCFELNWRAAAMARRAAGEDRAVAGSIGPSGKPFHLHGQGAAALWRDAYADQVRGLAAGGVDLFFIETQVSAEEAVVIAEAAREFAPEVPRVLAFTFGGDGRTPHGSTLREAAEAAERAGAVMFGINCGIGPVPTLQLVREARALTRLPIACKPNAGFPRFVEETGGFTYPSSPAHFRKYALEFVREGARLVGGCCGTTPDHVRAMADGLKARGDGATAVAVLPVEDEEEAEKAATRAAGARNPVPDLLQRRKFLTVEILPPKGTETGAAVRRAQALKKAGVDAVNVSDSPLAKIRMSSIPFAYLLKEKVGVEPVLHFACRDRNLGRIHSDLLGAHALGIRNVLAITGDPPTAGDYPQATAVYDVTAKELIKLITNMNRGKDYYERDVKTKTEFFVAGAMRFTPEDYTKEKEGVEAKVAAGVHFFFSQPVYESASIEKYFERCGPLPVPVVVGLMPPRSVSHADFLNNEVPGIRIPEKFLKFLAEVEAKGGDVLKESATALLTEVEKMKGLVNGFYLTLAGQDAELVNGFRQAL